MPDLGDRTRRLSAVGVELLRPWPLDDAVVTPPDVAWSASACGRESGRIDHAFDDTDADRIAKGNAAWLAAAERFALFDAAGTFLLSVATDTDDDPRSWWFQARVTGGWDLIGRGAEARVLGHGWGVPAFVTHSADGNVLIAASAYETCFSVFVVPAPSRASVLRRSAAQLLDATPRPSDRRSGISRWLGL
ncbi:hypothetical protein [Phytohabitans rumicis]|nr:hypothetical protein [Phytohabitans rumicis]